MSTTSFASNYSATTPTTTTPPSTTTSPIYVPPNPNSIAPPPPVFNCNDPDNSYIIGQTCAINKTDDPTYIAQVINETATTIHEIIKNDTFTPENVHDTGIFLYHTVTTVDSLTTDSAHKFLDITSTVVVQPLQKLADANNITSNSLLWYPSSIPKVVAKTDQDLNYTKNGTNLLLHSFTLSPSFCNNAADTHEICYSKNSEVPSGSKDAEFCTTINPKSICTNGTASKAYLTMWKSLSFFTLVKNNSMGIKTGLEDSQTTTPDQPVTFNTADRCADGTYLKNNYGSNVGGIDQNGESISTGSTSSIWIKRRDDENDLHVTGYKIAKFTKTSFEDAQTSVTKKTEHYTAQCPDGTCILIADGNPTEPTLCSTPAKKTQNIVVGIGIVLSVIAIGRFNDKNLPKRVKFFAYCYNITFMLYAIYLILIAQQDDISDKMCTIYAIVGYVLYISAIFLSVIMITITLDTLGCWKPMIRNTFYVFTGNQIIFVPFIYSFGVPALLTAGFAVALNSFFKRNDGYCWIRPDYAFPALWIPLILLLLTIPLYIILIARRWPNVGLFKAIYGPLTVPEEIALFEELRRKKEDAEKEEDIEEFKKKILGKSYLSNGVESVAAAAEEEKVILTSRTIARLMIPQLFLAIPLIAENLALYYANVTGWHYLFILTQGLQPIVLNAIDWVDDLPDKIADIKDRIASIGRSPKEVIPEETRWGTETTANPKTNTTGFTRM
uniref:G-protein coupled receptors family 2 profile 2 domain-containing protein n=1 Tax=Panagrolaimus sp. ES5 TaxID=591445 RepID=A0AC34FNU3_9BILA